MKINGVDVEFLKGVVEAVKENPNLGKTIWRATSVWKDGFKCEARIRGFRVQMDEPADLGGTNTAPNMVEMVLGAYGCCLIVGYVMNAAVRGIEIQKLEIDVEGDIDLPGFLGLENPDEVWPGFTEVRARVFLKTKQPIPKEELRQLHEAVTKTSPVGSILGRNVKVETVLVERRFPD